jgi:hypothetical protein
MTELSRDLGGSKSVASQMFFEKSVSVPGVGIEHLLFPTKTQPVFENVDSIVV